MTEQLPVTSSEFSAKQVKIQNTLEQLKNLTDKAWGEIAKQKGYKQTKEQAMGIYKKKLELLISQEVSRVNNSQPKIVENEHSEPTVWQQEVADRVILLVEAGPYCQLRTHLDSWGIVYDEEFVSGGKVFLQVAFNNDDHIVKPGNRLDFKSYHGTKFPDINTIIEGQKEILVFKNIVKYHREVVITQKECQTEDENSQILIDTIAQFENPKNLINIFDLEKENIGDLDLFANQVSDIIRALNSLALIENLSQKIDSQKTFSNMWNVAKKAISVQRNDFEPIINNADSINELPFIDEKPPESKQKKMLSQGESVKTEKLRPKKKIPIDKMKKPMVIQKDLQKPSDQVEKELDPWSPDRVDEAVSDDFTAHHGDSTQAQLGVDVNYQRLLKGSQLKKEAADKEFYKIWGGKALDGVPA